MQLLVFKQNFSVEQKHVFQSEYHIKLIEQMVIQIPSKLYIKIIWLVHFIISTSDTSTWISVEILTYQWKKVEDY